MNALNNLFFGFIKIGILLVIVSLIVAGIMSEGTGFVLGIACAGLMSMVFVVALLEQKSRSIESSESRFVAGDL